MKLPEGYVARAARLDDVDGIVRLMNEHGQDIAGRDLVTPEEIRQQMQIPGLDLEKDTRVVEAVNGEIVGMGFAFAFAPFVQVQSMGVVLPKHCGKGIGSALLDWIEQRAWLAVDQASPEVRVTLMQGMDEREQAGRGLLEQRGYEIVRHFWKMVIEMDSPPPEPVWDEGIRLSVYDPQVDLERAFHAGRDAFKDHWGHVDSPVEEGLERVRHRIANDPEFDPSLRFLAWEGNEIVGVCYANAKDGPDRSTGYIATLGVRRPWRRRGIALALLRHAFGECYRRGLKRVALHVDAASLTGATRLYEKAGMHTDELNHAYEKELRAGIDHTTQSVS